MEFDETHCHCVDKPPHAQRLKDIGHVQTEAKTHDNDQPKIKQPHAPVTVPDSPFDEPDSS